MLDLNKIEIAVKNAEERIKTKNIGKEKEDQLFKKLDIDVKELVTYQNTKSELFAMQKISLDVANYLYNKLSNWSKTTLAERCVLNQLFLEIMLMRKKL